MVAEFLGTNKQRNLFLSPIDVSDPPPISPKTLELYFKWKCLPNTENVLDENGNYVYDINGEPLKGAKHWRAPGCLNKARAAFSMLHKVYDIHNCVYLDKCNQCVSLNKNNNTLILYCCANHTKNGA